MGPSVFSFLALHKDFGRTGRSRRNRSGPRRRCAPSSPDTDVPKTNRGPVQRPLRDRAGQMSAGSIAACRAELADLQAALVNKLAATMALSSSTILAVGIQTPASGIPSVASPRLSRTVRCRPLGRTTGMNVVDAFPARDLALGGRGGPVTAMAEWMLLRSQLRNRVLLDLGRTPGSILCPPPPPIAPIQGNILRGRAGHRDPRHPCRTPHQRRAPLRPRRPIRRARTSHRPTHPALETRPLFRSPPATLASARRRPERFLGDALQMAVAADWSVRDLLCTATCFIAEMIAETLTRRLPDAAQFDEIIVTGRRPAKRHATAKSAGLSKPR